MADALKQSRLRRRSLKSIRPADNAEQLTKLLSGSPSFNASRVGEILIEEGLVNREQLKDAIEIQQQEPHRRLGEILQERGSVTHETVLSTLALKLGIPFVQLKNFNVDPMAVSRLSSEMARRYQVCPLMFYQGRLVVALSDPTDQELTHLLRFLTGASIEPVIATVTDIRQALMHNYGASEEESAMGQLGIVEEGDSAQDSDAIEQLGSEKPVVRLVGNIIREAIQRRASDIHLRPQDGQVDLLYRIDGSLQMIRRFSKALLPAVVSRIKILGRMNIAERRLPQDGRTRVTSGEQVCDLRISIIPTSLGESVVIRVLNKSAGLKSIDEIGFNKRDKEIFEHLIHKPNGLLLVTGPTGSGKSTTLYAALDAVRKMNVKIITTENPVEYEMEDVEQIAVNTVPGYTFARALRHILRHDPDVIMVGEIRDRETAQIAVESSLTGHLVLSTLHTNSSAATVTRLVEMGVEPYLVSSTLSGVIAQRLVRRNCPHCRVEEKISTSVRKSVGAGPRERFYRGEGCDHCGGTGYFGRMVTYELMQVMAEMRKLIARNANMGEYFEQAVADGMVPLTQQALELARAKHTSLEEVYRVRLN